MPHIPGHRPAPPTIGRAWQQGLLRRTRPGAGFFRGMDFASGRPATLFPTPGMSPSPLAMGAAGSFINRSGAPRRQDVLSMPQGRKISDILGRGPLASPTALPARAGLGGRVAAMELGQSLMPSPMAMAERRDPGPNRAGLGGRVAAMELGQSLMPSPIAANAPIPPPGVMAQREASGRSFVGKPISLVNQRRDMSEFVPDVPGRPDLALSPMQGMDASGAAAADEGPQGFMGKIGGFFDRPGMGQAMMAAGGAMMSGRDAQGRAYTDPFQSLGAGLQAGLGAYGEAQTARQVEAEKAWEVERRDKLRAQEQASDEAFDQAGGRFIQDPHMRAVVRAMDVGKRTEWLTKHVNTAEGRQGIVASLMELDPNIPEETARLMSFDPDSALAFMNRPSDRRIFTDGNDQGWIVSLKDGVIGGPIGPVKTDLTQEMWDAQKREVERKRIQPQYDDIMERHDELEDVYGGMQVTYQAIDLLEREGPAAYQGPLAAANTWISRVWDSERAATTEQINKVLQMLGMKNLRFFRGAISEREMEQALRQAGTTGDLAAALRGALSSTALANIDELNAHNQKTERYLAGEDIKDWDYWTFDQDKLDHMQERAKAFREGEKPDGPTIPTEDIDLPPSYRGPTPDFQVEGGPPRFEQKRFNDSLNEAFLLIGKLEGLESQEPDADPEPTIGTQGLMGGRALHQTWEENMEKLQRAKELLAANPQFARDRADGLFPRYTKDE